MCRFVLLVPVSNLITYYQVSTTLWLIGFTSLFFIQPRIMTLTHYSRYGLNPLVFDDCQRLVLYFINSYNELLLPISTLCVSQFGYHQPTNSILHKFSLMDKKIKVIPLPHCIVVFHKVLLYIFQRATNNIISYLWLIVQYVCTYYFPRFHFFSNSVYVIIAI